MTSSVEIEIALHRAGGNYAIDLTLDRSDSEAETAPVRGEAAFDLDALRALSDDRREYGKLLYENLFADAKIREHFRIGCVLAENSDIPVRLRLFIDENAAELHEVCWEGLCDPSGELLATRERFLFSRFISNLDFRPVRFRARDELRALVVIANPSNVGDYKPGGRALAPLDVPGETKRATEALGKIPSTVLAAPPGSASLNGIVSKLREGYDILYLVCHGALIGGEPRLCLEDETGKAAIVLGTDLVTRLSELKQRPRLVVLASCQSAGVGGEAHATDEGLLASLGPRMAQAGIPAVVAMQGNVTMETVATFMPIFFRELEADGQIDRAMSVARGAVRDAEDWWMPVLFMSLKQGRIRWYVPGFTGVDPDFERWRSLVNNIRKGSCTPIIGSGMLESLVGSFRDIAEGWASTHQYPMAGGEREQLPLVAQFLVVNQGETTYARDEFRKALREGALRHYGHDLTDAQRAAPIEDLISSAGAVRRSLEPAEPHKVLASLGLPVYLTTNPDNLLSDALTEAARPPKVQLCPRGYEIAAPADDPGYRPTKETPLVYHLFGHLREPDSVVLTQDDYFDYLIDVTANKELIPGTVRSSLTNTALLFLGFQMTDWDFRVFFRSIMSQEGRSRRKRFSHVAVQLDPEQDRLIDPVRARRYLETYFLDTHISIYWGNAEDFLSELQRQMVKIP